MDLYLLRHAIAVERGTRKFNDDFDRPLTTEGEKKLRRVVKAMRSLEISFDVILSSPYVRARETAEIVTSELGLGKKLELMEALGVDGSAQELIQSLRTRNLAEKSVLLVGHEPYLSLLIGLLTTGTSRSTVIMKKAGLCKLLVANLRAGRCAKLEWFLAPRQMLLMT